ncbi:permease [Propionivibrio sp.]|uniref:permease n=1 Tax=Propionivibrio sp. TaxID=2212460 RepID=UPI003BF15671
MKTYRLRTLWLGLLATVLLAACATPPVPEPEVEAPPAPEVVMVNETAMLPLLGYLQRVHRMPPKELARERIVLAAIPQTPATQVRMAMLLGQPRGPMDLVRAIGLLEGVLKSGDPAAASLHPLARALANQYSERLKLHLQNEKLVIQNEKLVQQLKESMTRSDELQEMLDALAEIERSLPLRPKGGEGLPGAPR